jgi:hypothetical protein
LISSIIGEDVKELEFRPQDFITDIENKKEKSKKQKPLLNLTVYRLDFSAKIKTDDGIKNVLIEVQKAKFPTDIMRFRGYLAGHYSNKDNTQKVEIKKVSRWVGTPIISIYFLGHRLDSTDATVIGVKRTYTDIITGKRIETKEAFIESLTHDSFIIQIPELPHKRRNDLEILLGVFDQSNSVDLNHHILNVKEDDFSEKHRPIIRRLQKAIEEPEVKKKMELEDGIIDEMEDMQRDIEGLKQKNESMKIEIQKAEQDKQKAEQEKQKAEQENEILKKEIERIKKNRK